MQPIRITLEIHRTRDTEPGTGEVRGLVEYGNEQGLPYRIEFAPPDTPIAAAQRLLYAMSGELWSKAGVK
jgi:hypothetical protein